MSFMWALVRPFMSKKLRDRVKLLGPSADKLFELVDPKARRRRLGV
jgi:hypothetical protein